MSCPLIIPKGNDRSWTRAFYYAINKIARRFWWEQRCDEKIESALLDTMVKGIGYYHIGWKP